ncbi:TIR domain-containing protein [Spirilliplanes yamanashiensis]|uniref:TIR domain-containing protein n=1 Tax=Spirilliplanes yamanashiensis TaxID=42233 RepID=A0A8J3Y542_9ACTN|nr:TIR domain-containing protein [Spirilliplanes yamanashiensis]MDP9819602.1 WD40 repeat protein [Spirilliplanes yamanashiensis]GIJ01577.1 hypothetical protein Sya03_09290 [Spirilliplanes yamanashiensis]
MSFNGFISYSHAADGQLAPAVQHGLHRLAKPWHRRRALWIFRDQTGLSVTPKLWTSIQQALDSSEYFVLMASPEAARSPWVDREIEHWLQSKSPDRILPVLTDGSWQWDTASRDFTADSTAVPDALRGVFAEEPLYLDLRWARDDRHLTLRHSRFRDGIAQLAAPMHGVSKDELEGEDVRQHRRAGRLRAAAVTSLLALTVVASVASALAMRNATEARAATDEARRQQRVATEQQGSAARFADEARRQEGNARAQEARAKAAGSEAERQEKLAHQQRRAADQASAEVIRQLRNADQAATRARHQERLAQRQSELAAESAVQLRRLEQRAKEQERLAAEQEQVAAEAGAEARRQQQRAEEQERRAEEQQRRADEQEQQARKEEERAKEAGEEAARQKDNANLQQRIAVSRRLVNEARDTVRYDPQTALKLGIAAQALDRGLGTSRDLASLITSTRQLGTLTDVWRAEYGPSGLLATANGNGTVSLWDATNRADPRRLSTFGEPYVEFPTHLALSPDGTTLAVTRDKTGELWDVTEPSRPVKAAGLPASGGRDYSKVAFSPDGLTLVTADPGPQGRYNSQVPAGYATLWDVTDRTRPTELSALADRSEDSVVAFQFSSDGHTLVVGRGERTTVLNVTDRIDPVWQSDVKAPLGEDIVSVALSPSAPTLAIGDSSGKVTVHDLTNPASPRQKFELAGGKGGVYALDFSRDGSLLAAGDLEGTALLWQIAATPRELHRFSNNREVTSVAFSNDGRTLAAVDQGHTGTLWNVTDFAAPARVGVMTTQATVSVLAMWHSPDGRWVKIVTNEAAEVWELTDRAMPVRRGFLPLVPEGAHTGGKDSRGVDQAAFSPDGRIIATTIQRERRTITLTDVADLSRPATLATFKSGRFVSKPPTFTPDGRGLLVASYTAYEYWNLVHLADQGPVRTAVWSNDALSDRYALSPDGRKLVVQTSDRDFALSLWDVSDWTNVRYLAPLSGPLNYVTSLKFSPDSGTVAATAGQRALIWDIGNPAEPARLTSLNDHTAAVESVTFSQDGKTAATAGHDGRVILWGLDGTAKPVRLATAWLHAHRSPRALAFNPDGRTLAVTVVTNNDTRPTRTFQEVGLWDLTELNHLRADPGDFGCAVVGGGLTPAEWTREIPEIAYEPTCTG